jgi:hypothetical protein
MDSFNWLEWLGYTASAIILVSLIMSSVKRLRWINLAGSAVFAVYGMLIGSIPVAVMNIGIVIINIYYLVQMYGQKEYFKILNVGADSEYLKSFLSFYEREISKFSRFDTNVLSRSEVRFFILRNMVVAGIFICSREGLDTLKIELDFATPMYRDFKIGRFIFEKQRAFFHDMGICRLISLSDNPTHTKYLAKMGFIHVKDDIWELSI